MKCRQITTFVVYDFLRNFESLIDEVAPRFISFRQKQQALSSIF